ncbi:M15 family peptidase [Legionella septentrionalis]|nr:M15 family peptidase [Legionella septentrionalis]
MAKMRVRKKMRLHSTRNIPCQILKPVGLMRKKRISELFRHALKVACLLFIPSLFPLVAFAQENKPFIAIISNIPAGIKGEMEKYTWHPECPVPLNKLSYIKMRYWGFDNKPHMGEMIVNKSLATEITKLFKFLYEHKFPIERMELMHQFKGDDDASMLANNTSAFNCRALTGLPGMYSQHSYGRAIDINPRINPYVKGKIILPLNGTKFIDRQETYPGKITSISLVYTIFKQHGWDWGGDWYDVQDYQHFEKRVHGEKRNPYGYKPWLWE